MAMSMSAPCHGVGWAVKNGSLAQLRFAAWWMGLGDCFLRLISGGSVLVGGGGTEEGRFEDVSSPQEKFTVREGPTMNWLKESWACIPNVTQVETAV